MYLTPNYITIALAKRCDANKQAILLGKKLALSTK